MTEHATTNDSSIDGAASALDDGLGLKACRAVFVRMMKEENLYREPYARTSLRAHWTGPEAGFADEFLQRRWHDFKAGWAASRSPNGQGNGQAAPTGGAKEKTHE